MTCSDLPLWSRLVGKHEDVLLVPEDAEGELEVEADVLHGADHGEDQPHAPGELLRRRRLEVRDLVRGRRVGHVVGVCCGGKRPEEVPRVESADRVRRVLLRPLRYLGED